MFQTRTTATTTSTVAATTRGAVTCADTERPARGRGAAVTDGEPSPCSGRRWPIPLRSSARGEHHGRGRSCRAAQVLRPAAHPLVFRRHHGRAHGQRDRRLGEPGRARHLPAARRAPVRGRVRRRRGVAAPRRLACPRRRARGGGGRDGAHDRAGLRAADRRLAERAAGRALDPRGVQGLPLRARARHDRGRPDRLLARRLPLRLLDGDARRRVRRAGPGAGARRTSRPWTTARPASSPRARRCCS